MKTNQRGPGFTPDQLHSYKLLNTFREHLGPVLDNRTLVPATELDPRRTLHAEGYLCGLLFGLFNPVVKSMRALCAASHFERVKNEVFGTSVSLGSFSEMQSVIEPQLLAGLVRSLGKEAQPSWGDKRVREHVGELIANDGTLLPALPRMAWALWQDEKHRAGKLHLEFSVFRQTAVGCEVTDANHVERKQWERTLDPGCCYVNDRNYSHDHALLARLQQQRIRFVMRLHNNTIITPIEAPRELSEADRLAGVVSDTRVRLGGKPDGPVGRLVEVHADGHVLLLFTSLDSIEAELVSLIYRYRWQVELFFKWLKCILGCRHWMAHSQRGVTLQVYCALIASILMVLWTGAKPTKRQWEALQFYWLGVISIEELQSALGKKKI